MTLLMDLNRGCIHSTSPGNTEVSLAVLLKELKPLEISSIEAIAIDMHGPYKNAVKAFFPVPQPVIVHDRFHIVSNMNTALSEVRIAEARELAEEGRRDLVGARQMILFWRGEPATETQEALRQIEEEQTPHGYGSCSEGSTASTLGLRRNAGSKEPLQKMGGLVSSDGYTTGSESCSDD